MSSIFITAGIRDATSNFEVAVNQLAITTTGGDFDYRRISVGTSEEEHTFNTDIGNANQMLFINRNATNYVEVGYATTVYSHKVLAGHPMLISLQPTQASIFLKANTAACDCEIYVREV